MKTNFKAIIKMAMGSRNNTQAAVAKKAGWANQSSLATAINRESPSIETMFRILDALEYDIVVVDRNSNTKFTLTRVEGDD